METFPNKMVQYDFSEKFFQIEPEGRIRRYQYIARMVGGGFALWLISIPINIILLNGYSSLFSVGQVIIILGGYFLWFVLNIKRSRDIGRNIKIVQYITLGLIIWNLLFGIYTISGELGWIPEYKGWYERWTYQMESIMYYHQNNSLALPPYQELGENIHKGIGIIAIILFLYLLTIPGMKGKNEYGDDPINTKVTFLG